ncbi:LysR family transcriptional regulator, partial [Staphylococcus capitis]|uniref:LysR family transcriptional regulator n=2 Tax=Staphylococcus TaxID=1279 RepID=UPI0030C3D369
MNFEYIQDFIRVAEYNSINKASQELNISTPALSKRIKSVEAYFNCHLFYRTSKGIFLNEEGKLVFNTFREMQHSIADLEKQL